MTNPPNLPPSDRPTGLGSKIMGWLLLVLGGILLIPLLPFSIKIVSEYERGVIFRLGRLIGAKGCYRDPVRSSQRHTVLTEGVEWFQVQSDFGRDLVTGRGLFVSI